MKISKIESCSENPKQLLPHVAKQCLKRYILCPLDLKYKVLVQTKLSQGSLSPLVGSSGSLVGSSWRADSSALSFSDVLHASEELVLLEGGGGYLVNGENLGAVNQRAEVKARNG